MPHFSHLTRAKAMRRLLVNGGLWGAYGQLIVVSGPIFTGLALWMGLEAADIALVASIVALAGLVQPVSSFLTGKLRNQKAFVIRFGLIEVSLTTSVVLIPLLFHLPSTRFVLVATAVLTGTFSGNLAAPVFNSWFSTVLPDESRAGFMGRRLVLVNLAAMAAGYGAGQFIDLSGGVYLSFLVPYATAWITGAIGYLVLSGIPFPIAQRPQEPVSFNRALTAPLRSRRFRFLLLFYLSWVFAVLIADPFYNVFMIQDLGVGYARIGVLNAVVLGVGILGYWLWGWVAGRYGSKPVLEMLMIPRLVLPLIWILLNPQNSGVLLLVIMALNGVVFSGLTVAINTLLFGSVAAETDRSAFFAIWAFSTSLTTAVATGLGGLIVRNLTEPIMTVAAIEISGIRFSFLLSGTLMIVPLVLLRWVQDTDAQPVKHIVGQMLRGNPVGFVYNAFLFSRNRRGKTRAKAARAMGKSRNPMAVEHLARAMGDIDPDVREQAAKGLGDTKSADAVEHLAAALADDESDVRAEAAEALGRLRHRSGIDPLFKALDSEDSRIAISAARALGDIGGADVAERLWLKLESAPGKVLKATLIESLSRFRDLRVVGVAIEALEVYRSPVVRLQLLNAACRALGAKNLFYNLIAKDRYELAERLDQMVQTMIRRVKRFSRFSDDRGTPGEALAELKRALVEGRYTDFPNLAVSVADSIELDEDSDVVAVAARDALGRYAQRGAIGETERPGVFSIVCLGMFFDSLVY